MSLEYTLLGLLRRKPRTGYELSKIVARTTNFYWTATRTQVYQSLKRMADRDWIEMETIPQVGKPSRQVYHLQPSGDEAFHQWLRRDPDKPVIKQPLLVQLYFMDCLEKEEVLDKINADMLVHIQRLNEYHEYEKNITRSKRPSKEKLADYLPLMAGIDFEEMQIKWCAKAIKMVEGLD
ncbi:MAG: PadR family transcriptional regulator [Syntrophomonadaceae bacterium]|nr:PadR family transcriptional regulator [Syntrophomonadaceae bacterium]